MIKAIFLLSLISLSFSALSKDKVEIAINCGGEAYMDDKGVAYEKDNYFDAGTPSDYGLQYDIRLTKDEPLYQTERWHSNTLTYSVPLKNPGKFVLVLKFAEVYFNDAGEKIFDVAIGKQTIIKDLDIFAKVGKATAHDEFIEFELRDNEIYYKGSVIEGAYDSKTKKIKIRFVKGRADNAKINAILIVRGTLKDTDFEEKKKVVDEIKKKKIKTQRQAHFILRRHSLDEENEDLVDDGSEDIPEVEEVTPFTIFFTIHGSYILISLAVFSLIYYALDAI